MAKRQQFICFGRQAEAIGTKHKDFKILCSDAVRNRFIEGDQSKNTFGSHYHVRECQTQTLRMAFSEFAQCTQTWTSRLLYFKVRAKIHDVAFLYITSLLLNVSQTLLVPLN